MSVIAAAERLAVRLGTDPDQHGRRGCDGCRGNDSHGRECPSLHRRCVPPFPPPVYGPFTHRRSVENFCHRSQWIVWSSTSPPKLRRRSVRPLATPGRAGSATTRTAHSASKAPGASRRCRGRTRPSASSIPPKRCRKPGSRQSPALPAQRRRPCRAVRAPLRDTGVHDLPGRCRPSAQNGPRGLKNVSPKSGSDSLGCWMGVSYFYLERWAVGPDWSR